MSIQILDYTAAEIDALLASVDYAALTEKTTPAGTDMLLLQDNAASGAPKKVKVSSLPGGGSGTLDIHGLTAATALDDTDEFPYYDVAAGGNRKTLWSNIKSVLKTYLDTLYLAITSFTDANITTTDVATNNAGTSKHGWLIKATAPSSGLRNVVAIDNGETVYKNAALFDATSPTTQAYGDVAATGSAMTAARRDHKHAFPASTKDTTAISGLLKGNGSAISAAISGTDYQPGLMPITAISTSSTLAPAHLSNTLRCTSASTITITVPPNSSVAFAVGTMIILERCGAGAVTVAPGSGVTVNSADAKLSINKQYQQALLLKVATDTWDLVGALA